MPVVSLSQSLPKRPMSVNLLVATAGDLQRHLSSGHLTSVELVNACLDKIEQYDDYLHAVISRPPRANLVEQAQNLDIERKAKKARGKLHGIPILIKVGVARLIISSRHCLIPLPNLCIQDNIATLPEFHMGTTAGSLALAGSKPKSNADIIDRVKTLLYSPKRQNTDLNPACWSRSDYCRQGKPVGMLTSGHPHPDLDLLTH